MANRALTTFVEDLRTFHDSLPAEQQPLLDKILVAALDNADTAGYGVRLGRTEELEGEDTEGYHFKVTNHPSERDFRNDEVWQQLIAWLGSEDDTVGYGQIRKPPTIG